MNIQNLAAQALERIAGLDAELQCNLGTMLLRDWQERAGGDQKDLIERAFGVMAKFPHFARARAAVLVKTLQSLSAQTAQA